MFGPSTSRFNENNPDVQYEGATYQLAINTAQVGRTFQDRSHVFRTVSRPPTIPRSAKIINCVATGMRGNNQQVYPASEYGFSCDKERATTNDFFHFQWEGRC